MKRTWTIIGVRDVPASFKWYQSLFGQPETPPVHDYFGQIFDTDGTVLLCLHQWGTHEHPSLMSHGLVARFPFVWVALERRLSVSSVVRIFMRRIDRKTKANSARTPPPRSASAGFIEPMLLLRTDSLPDSEQWLYELKLDGYRAIAFKRDGVVHLRSRNDNDFSGRYPGVVTGLANMPDNTVIDGEVIAFDDDGRPSFNALQNYGSATAPVVYYAFDVMVLAGRDVMRETLETRRELLEQKVLQKLSEPVRYATSLDAALPVLVQSVKTQGFEGLVAKRRNSVYEPGLRTGAWMTMRVNRRQEFVIGGYTRGTKTFDALIFGYYQGDKLIYIARTRNGFTRVTRAQLFRKFKGLEISGCPFANLPEAKSGRWGQGLTKAKMAECQWLKPGLVGQFEFLEWTADDHLRHSKFVGLREDKKARDIVRE
jgi:DNA ligase D-like protein (predicted ligase)